MNNLLIACAPRTGTVYTSTLFKTLNISAGHEWMRPELPYHPARFNFRCQVEVSYGAVTDLQSVETPYNMAIQLKHPLLVIRRFMHVAKTSTSGIEDYTNLTWPGLLSGLNLLDKCCMMFYNWYNVAHDFMAQMPADKTHIFKVEDMKTEIFRLLELVGVERDKDIVYQALSRVPTNVNTKIQQFNNAYKDVSFEDLTSYMQDYIIKMGYPKDPRDMERYA